MNLLKKIKCPDFVSLDTLGFAQVGFADYNQKIISEKKIIDNFFKDSKELAVPLFFIDVAFFKWNQCPHDFGLYWDFTICYDRDFLDDLELTDEANYFLFWEWIDRCQSALSLNEKELLIKCEKDYENYF